ncbi:MAG: DUF1801 domain-containing protein [Myxococcales bacterium]|nr:DUF1801 domain-containing protein [Myxococcales bacterium]
MIDKHLRKFTGAQRAGLQTTVAIIRAALPGATEVIAYGMPTFKVDGLSGPAVIGLDGFRAHNSVFPYSTRVMRELADALAPYTQTKGSIHFAVDRAFPASLLKRILKARMREINDSYPKSSGVHREFYDNGFEKAAGKIKDGEMHGAWKWFRRDGVIMRSGAFRGGAQVGEWVTYDREGRVHKVTQIR